VAGILVAGFLVQRACSAPPAKAQGPRAVPVAVAQAMTRDLDVRFSGIGTVTTRDTVTVKSRVDGQLMRLGFREGQMVRQGDLIAEIDPRPYRVQLMQAEGQMAKDMAALRTARKDLQRFTTLGAQGILSRQQSEAQASTVEQLEGAVRMDKAQVESARLNLTYCRITAPVAGKVGLRGVDPGNLVKASDATGLVVITPLQPINVSFTLPADQIQPLLDAIHSGRSLQAEAYDRDLKNRLALGTLDAMDNQVDPATGTVRLKALFRNENLALFPNQFVNVYLKVDTLKGAVVIPTAALQRSPQATFVYVVKGDSTVDMRTVAVRHTDGETCAIATGLASGETVVVDGLDKLRPGSKVALPGKGGPRKDGK
jgi:multidrug efflux system membrane fusion protein